MSGLCEVQFPCTVRGGVVAVIPAVDDSTDDVGAAATHKRWKLYFARYRTVTTTVAASLTSPPWFLVSLHPPFFLIMIPSKSYVSPRRAP